MAQKDKTLRASEVAKRLDVTAETVRAWGRTGKIRVQRHPGGRMKFFESDIAAIEQGTTNPAQSAA
jgi:excisionase family DNA binding protein